MDTTRTFDPLDAISLARTALDDPAGLPEGDTLDDVVYDDQNEGPASRYVIDKLDQAISSLHYGGGSGNDNRGEARWVAQNIAALCETFQCEMATEAAYDDHDDESRRAYLNASERARQAAQALMYAVARLER